MWPKPRKILLALLVAFLATASVMAQGTKLKLYAGYNYISPTGETSIDQSTIEAAEANGWVAGVEWRLDKLIGLEFDVIHADHDISYLGNTVATTSMSPYSFSFNLHPVHSKFFDFYVGPTISYVQWNDIHSVGAQFISIPTDDEFTYGAQVGLDLSVLKNFAVVTGLRYTKLQVEATDTGENIDVDPIFGKIGVAFRF